MIPHFFLSLSSCSLFILSSQLCRLAYELMQNHHVDASGKFYSLDDHYYFGGQIQRKERVLMDKAGIYYTIAIYSSGNPCTLHMLYVHTTYVIDRVRL